MLDVDEINRHARKIEPLLRLKTYPIAVKMLQKEQDIPDGAKRPVKDREFNLALCQAISLARRQGESLVLLKEDM